MNTDEIIMQAALNISRRSAYPVSMKIVREEIKTALRYIQEAEPCDQPADEEAHRTKAEDTPA